MKYSPLKKKKKIYTDGLQPCEVSKTDESTCCGCLLLRSRQRQHRTRQVTYRTTVCVALYYLALSSVRVYTLCLGRLRAAVIWLSARQKAASGVNWVKLG